VDAAALLRERIAREGPVSFETFMETALYDPRFGYYRGSRDPFGRRGDFYTAAQLPAFGLLLRAALETLTPHRTVADFGSGRGELGEAFDGWRYVPVELGDPAPAPFDGVIVANELFDALPCRAFGAGGEALVDWNGERFVFTRPPVREDCPRAAEVLKAMAGSLRRGLLMVIDYGYEEPERERRFPRGSLMSYRKHSASEDVLESPGERDITFHVNFTRLIEAAEKVGWRLRAKESLRSFLLRAGERAVEEARRAGGEGLKTLLFSFGERFDALRFERRETLDENGA
jgi:SAM-dependent MidA family methyltransferase